MRVWLAGAGLCAFVSGAALASSEYDPSEISFAYAARHDVAALPARVVEAMHPGEDVTVYRREDAAPVMLPPDQKLPRPGLTRADLCSAVASVAAANDLPAPFFANLIQQESAFRPHAISPVGAQGIAQFMPRTARAYGLHNPFDPIHAIAVSGQFLRELLGQFGNLGLAAAAYNAGPGRVLNWVQSRGKLPDETQNYVKTITGRPALQWARPKKDDEIVLPPHARCPGLPSAEAAAVAMKEPAVKVTLADPNRAKAVASKGKGAKPVVLAAAARGKRVTAVISTKKGASGMTLASAKSTPATKPAAKKSARVEKPAAKPAAAGKSIRVAAAR